MQVPSSPGALSLRAPQRLWAALSAQTDELAMPHERLG